MVMVVMTVVMTGSVSGNSGVGAGGSRGVAVQ